MTDLKKPDLSKDTTGPFVTRDGLRATYAGPAVRSGKFAHTVLIDGAGYAQVRANGGFMANDDSEHPCDIFLAPKEPKYTYMNIYGASYDSIEDANDDADSDRLALLQLEVDDQGVPVDGSTVRRVEG